MLEEKLEKRRTRTLHDITTAQRGAGDSAPPVLKHDSGQGPVRRRRYGVECQLAESRRRQQQAADRADRDYSLGQSQQSARLRLGFGLRYMHRDGWWQQILPKPLTVMPRFSQGPI
ncbi:hypothetical protein [Qipengyuania citrea]|uniref:hypothetical protein n=1 Tax=Qipengyuania citrea TaxID=225971 RepID=UPI003264E465